MEFFSVDNKKNIPNCPKCSGVIKFQINSDDFSVSYICHKGHTKKNIPLKIFNEKFIKSSQTYKVNCSNCFNFLEDSKKNYKCKICNKLYCSGCINRHNKKMKHDSKSIFINQYQLCTIHNQKFSLFCETCESNICSKCKNSHKNHCLKEYVDVIPNKKCLDSVNSCFLKFKNKISDLLNNINTLKKEITKRYNQIHEFLNCLISTNEKLLINFNLNYFDYFNYENFNYLLSNLNDKNILDQSKYINYLLDKNIKNQTLKKNNEIKIESNKHYIENFTRLKYIKENIFYVYENKILKFFEFKDFSFNSIASLDLKKYDIFNVKHATYSDYFFINLNYKNKIKFLKYDLTKKKFKLSKKEIIDPNAYYYEHFQIYFDLKDGTILTCLYPQIIVWKENPKKNNYTKHLTINNVYYTFFNINSDLFCFQDNVYTINFYETEYFTCKKTIRYTHKINLLGVINNEAIVFNEYYNENKIFIVDKKYLEIVQKIYMNLRGYSIIIKDNYFMNFFIEKKKLKIIKRKFNKCFDIKEIFIEKTSLNAVDNVIITDIGYLVLCNKTNISFIKLNY